MKYKKLIKGILLACFLAYFTALCITGAANMFTSVIVNL